MKDIAATEFIEKRIYVIGGQKVMGDVDLAHLYGVTTKAFNQTIKRNKNRFPSDFMFSLLPAEQETMRSHFVTASQRNKRFAPIVFTEQGVSMLSGVLRSDRAVRMNVAIMRAFIKLRSILKNQKEFTEQFEKLEQHLGTHDKPINSILNAIHQLMGPRPPKRKASGFMDRGNSPHV